MKVPADISFETIRRLLVATIERGRLLSITLLNGIFRCAPSTLFRRGFLISTALCGAALGADPARAANFTITNTNDSGAGSLRQAIIDGPGKHSRLFVLLNKDVRDYIVRLTDQWLGMTYIQVGVAMIVAVLGIVNSLTVSIVDRRRELGVLRAVGGLRAQIRGTVWMEALTIGAIGLILGAATGAIGLFYELQTIRTDLVGMVLPFTFPTGIMGMLVPVILGAAFVAAVAPAESAVRSSLVEALEYE